MSLTQDQFDIQVVNAQCCAANKASNLVDLLRAGDLSAECAALKFFALMAMISALENYDITDDCLTETEYCATLSRINSLCSDCCG